MYLSRLAIALSFCSLSFAQFAPSSFEIGSSRTLDTSPPEERLSSSVIIDILPGLPGYTWLGTGRGVSLHYVVREGDVDYNRFRSWSAEQGVGRGGVSGMAVTDSIIWAAFAFDTTVGISGAGGGLAYSRDQGGTWTWLEQPQDRLYDLRDDGYDRVLGYWPTATNVDNITYAIALSDSFVWSVSKGAGLRKHAYAADYTDYNDTTGWRVVTTDSFAFNPLQHLNHRGFSVIYDGAALWVGSADGISKSVDEGRTWTRYTHATHGISGNFVTSLGYQEATGAIWAATWRAEGLNEYYAVSRTLDGGASWTVHLTEEQIQDAIGRSVTPRAHSFAFDGEIVYVCDDIGLWKSTDMGNRWGLFPQMQDSLVEHHRFYDPDIFAATEEDGLLWAGGVDGLAASRSNGAQWHVFRANEPLHESSRTADTYAYPNPFSPQRHSVVRLRLDGPGGMTKAVIYDFSMTKVTETPSRNAVPGEDYITWDGKKDGTIIANGTYFYKIEHPGGDVWGKLIILD